MSENLIVMTMMLMLDLGGCASVTWVRGFSWLDFCEGVFLTVYFSAIVDGVISWTTTQRFEASGGLRLI